MTLYEADLTTLEMVKNQIDTAQTGDDDLIKQFIRQASVDISASADRAFVPYLDAREFSLQRSAVLLMDDDLLSVTAITDGQGAVELANVQLIERNEYPAFGLKLINRDYWKYPLDCNTTGYITVTGWWGYNINPAKMWKARTTLTAGIDNDDATMTVTSSTALNVLDYLKIGDEVMQVLSITVAGAPSVHTVGIDRGLMGTTAANHLNGAAVNQYQQKSNIQLAATMLAQFLYQNRDKPGTETVQTPQGTMVISLQAPKIAREVVNRYARQTPQIAMIRR